MRTIRAMQFRRLFFCACAAMAFATNRASADGDGVGAALPAAAVERTRHRVLYDPTYRVIDYPMGDVAPDRGVCADVVIRALRALDIDLQELVHEDMRAAFSAYPKHWGLAAPDRNIDHRRVPNLETFFTRKGARLPPSVDADDYQPGDIISWNLRGESGGWLPHIGVVSDQRAPSGRLMIAHNIGAGPRLEDVLFDWPMTGRFRINAEIGGQ